MLPCVGTIAAIERLNFSGLCYADGPSGYARSDGVSVFPSGITVAATWDSELMFERALALGEEFRHKGAHVHLGYDQSLHDLRSGIELTTSQPFCRSNGPQYSWRSELGGFWS